MNKSKLIALCGICCSFSVLLLVVGAFFPTFDLSALFMASLIVVLPLSKKSYGGAIITVIATSLLSLFISGFRYQIVIPYILFFGFHPIVNFWEREKKFNKYLMLIIKDIWFVICLCLMQWLSEVLVIDLDYLRKYVYLFLIVGGLVLFVVYDYFINRFSTYIIQILKRLKL